MRVKVSTIENNVLWGVFALSFFGFYSIILVLFNIGLGDITRLVSIPVRMLIGLGFFILMILNFDRLNGPWQSKVFILFALLFILRIVIDEYTDEPYYLRTRNNLFFFLSFSVLPFLTIATFNLTNKKLTHIFNSLLISGLVFSALAVFMYGRFFGQVGRLTNYSADEAVVSPLILSYSSTLIIGVVIVYFLNNQTSIRKKIIGYTAIGLAVVPFFLGASRGALVALVFSLTLYSLYRGNFIKGIFSLIFFGIVLIILFQINSSASSGLVDRFSGLFDGISGEDSSSARILIWKDSVKYFMDYPIFGDKLKIDGWDSHPHNMPIEVFKTMGILGLIPYLLLIFSTFRLSFKMIRNQPQYSWVPVIFFQCFTQNLFSGSITNASWFWLSMALVISVNEYLMRNEREVKFDKTLDIPHL